MGEEKKQKLAGKEVQWKADPKIIMVIRKNAEWVYETNLKGKQKKIAECVSEDTAAEK